MTRALVAALVRALLLCAGARATRAVRRGGEPDIRGQEDRAGRRHGSAQGAADQATQTGSRSRCPERQKELQGEQQELRRQLGSLKQQLMAAEASRTEAADALAASEAAISKANRRLRELGDERTPDRAADREPPAAQPLRHRRPSRASRLQLAETLRQHYQLTLRDPLQAFLAGENPADLGRDAEYYGYLSRAASQRIGELQERRTELEQLEARIEEEERRTGQDRRR